MKCVANVEGELGLGLRWFRSHHPKCTGWKYELEKLRDKDSTRRLYRARTSLCSPDFLEDMTFNICVLRPFGRGSRVLVPSTPPAIKGPNSDAAN